MKKFWYCIKDYTGDEFDNEFKPRYGWRHVTDHDEVAEEIAEDHYHHDPCDPNQFEPVIGVKDEAGLIKWFQISAEPMVSFHAHEMMEQPK